MNVVNRTGLDSPAVAVALSEPCGAVQPDDRLAGAGRAADPCRALEPARDDRPLVGVEEDHPVLDRASEDVGEELRLGAGEPGARSVVVELILDLTVVRRSTSGSSASIDGPDVDVVALRIAVGQRG